MGFSNVGLGIVHSMAHPLGAFYDTPHGVANALLLPYVMEYNAESPAAPKYIHIAKAMGVDTTGMSETEGVKMYDDISGRLDYIEETVGKIERELPGRCSESWKVYNDFE